MKKQTLKKYKMKLIKTLIICTIFVILSSCTTYSAETDYNKASWELKKKNAELDYLQRLYRIKSDIEFKEKIKNLDSLILLECNN